MMDPERVNSLEELFERLETVAAEGDQVSMDAVLESVGRRSFGPWLLILGLITLSPIGDIPSVPTMMAAILFLIAMQLLLGYRHFWLPKWLKSRSVSSRKFCKAIKFLRKPARFIDRLLHTRWEIFTGGVGAHVIAVLCLVIALGLPPMEFVPFTATGAGIAMTAFGLALIANDGALAAIAMVFAVGTYGFLIFKLAGG